MCRLTGCQRVKREARFWAQTKLLPNGCRVWTGAQSRGGKREKSGPYGSFKVGRDAEGNDINAKRAHVVAAFLKGMIPTLHTPKGFHIDHDESVCDSGTLCVEHLRLIPDKENILLGRRPVPAKARAIAQEIAEERRRRMVRDRRKRAAKRRKQGPGNPDRKAHG